MFEFFLKQLNSWGYTIVPLDPTLAMLDEGWGICGTELSEIQPNMEKKNKALIRYGGLLNAAKHKKIEGAAIEVFVVLRVIVGGARTLTDVDSVWLEEDKAKIRAWEISQSDERIKPDIVKIPIS